MLEVSPASHSSVHLPVSLCTVQKSTCKLALEFSAPWVTYILRKVFIHTVQGTLVVHLCVFLYCIHQSNTDRDVFEEMKSAKEDGSLDSILVREALVCLP